MTTVCWYVGAAAAALAAALRYVGLYALADAALALASAFCGAALGASIVRGKW